MKNNKTKKNNKSVYSINDYRSNDGMLTTVWGPGMWHYLHTMSFNYPVNPSKEDKKHYSDFILQLQYVLPCGKCRKNLKKNFKKLPLTSSNMESRETFSRYIYDLHEVINTMLKKNSGLSYEDVRERYEHFRARCAKSYTKLTNESVKLIKRKTVKKEKGCTVPLYGEKSKCILKIVPHDTKCETLQIDSKCIKREIKI
jgi:hypothetical protein